MNLSNVLLNNLSNKLKIDPFFLKEEKSCINSLTELLISLSELEDEVIKLKTIWKNKASDNVNLHFFEQDFVIAYIITITFLKANTMIHIADSIGNTKWFCSSGSVGITGKQKKKRRSVILKLINLSLKKANFVAKSPVALHFNNVNSYQTFIVDRLKQDIFVKIIKSFNQTPYNGCRKKKIRRKKYSKIFT